MFDLGGRLMLVDLPGYGFAQAPKPKVDAWQKLVRTYLRGRSSLVRTCVLVDARHGLKEADQQFTTMLGEVAVAYQLVLTKVDQVRPVALEELIESLEAELARKPGAHPGVVATSAREGTGIERLRAALALLATPAGEARR
jgi:GTP-binding protein